MKSVTLCFCVNSHRLAMNPKLYGISFEIWYNRNKAWLIPHSLDIIEFLSRLVHFFQKQEVLGSTKLGRLKLCQRAEYE